MRSLHLLLFLFFPLLCLADESCMQLKQTLGLSSSNPPENILECLKTEEGGKVEIPSNCSCAEGFQKCGLSLLIAESLINLNGTQNETRTVGGDVIEVAGMRFSRRLFQDDDEYEDESLSDFRIDESHCKFCCRVDQNSTNKEDTTNQKTTKDRKLGTALTAGVMLGMIVVVVLISIAASKFSKCSAKGNTDEVQEPETKTPTNTG